MWARVAAKGLLARMWTITARGLIRRWRYSDSQPGWVLAANRVARVAWRRGQDTGWAYSKRGLLGATPGMRWSWEAVRTQRALTALAMRRESASSCVERPAHDAVQRRGGR